MQIRRQSDVEFDAYRHGGSLDALLTFLVNQTDFAYLVVNKDLTVSVSRTSSSTAFPVIVGDYIRIKEDVTLDRISAANFVSTWEPVNPAP